MQSILNYIYLQGFRHYWVQVDYSKQFELLSDGNLTTSNATINPNDYDDNYNSFTIDFLTKWQFAPASEIEFRL